MNSPDYYKYNVFISYAKPNKQEAEKFYHSIVSKGFNAFFAPLTLNLSEEEEFQFWVDPLTDYIVYSEHLIAIVSNSYIESSWCELEVRGFRNLCKIDDSRCLFLIDLDGSRTILSNKLGISEPNDTEKSVTNWFVANCHPYRTKHADGLKEITIEMPGWSQQLSPFRELPLRKMYDLSAPWKKNSMTPGGHPAGPSYQTYEHWVREAMVRILRGASTKSLIAEIPPNPQIPKLVRDLVRDAKELLDMAIDPFTGPYEHFSSEKAKSAKLNQRIDEKIKVIFPERILKILDQSVSSTIIPDNIQWEQLTSTLQIAFKAGYRLSEMGAVENHDDLRVLTEKMLLAGLLITKNEHYPLNELHQLFTHFDLSCKGLLIALAGEQGTYDELEDFPHMDSRIRNLLEKCWDLTISFPFDRMPEPKIHVRHLVGAIILEKNYASSQTIAWFLDTSSIDFADIRKPYIKKIRDTYLDFLAIPNGFYLDFLQSIIPEKEGQIRIHGKKGCFHQRSAY